MHTHPLSNYRLATLHQDGLLAAAGRDRQRAAAASVATRPVSRTLHLIGAFLIRAGRQVRGEGVGARLPEPSLADR